MRLLISIGGIGTILAVSGILVFLAWVVLPLFTGARFEAVARGPSSTVAARAPGVRVLASAVDAQGLVGWELRSDGRIEAFRIDTGEGLESRELAAPGSLTSCAASSTGDEIALPV